MKIKLRCRVFGQWFRFWTQYVKSRFRICSLWLCWKNSV